MIELPFWEERKLQDSLGNRGKGCLENMKDLDEDTIEEIILNCFCKVQPKDGQEQRIDSRRISIARKLRKIPDSMLKHLKSNYMYMNLNFNLVIESYCYVFVFGFLLYFGLHPDVSKFDLFLNFILLYFPESKVTKILNELLKAKSLSKKKFDNLLAQFEKRTCTPQRMAHKLYLCNPSFDLIITKAYENLSRMNLSEKDIIEKILRNIIGAK